MTWKVLRMVALDGYAVAYEEGGAVTEYWNAHGPVRDARQAHCFRQDDAITKADELNGKRPRLNATQFDERTRHVPMEDRTRAALRAIMVDGATWRHAAEVNGITESGIKRALDRVRRANP